MMTNLFKRALFQLRTLAHLPTEIDNASRLQSRILQEFFVSNLLTQPRYTDPKRLNRHERQVFSQNGEDGIICEILRRIGCSTRTFVEIGVGDGIENNTAYLLFQGWRGWWFDGDANSVAKAKKKFSKVIDEGRLHIAHEFVTAEEVESMFCRNAIPNDIDVLSLDIDRNTPHIWAALRNFRPKIVIVEYNASIPPHDDWQVEYRNDATWNGTLYFGASLKRLEHIGRELGYALVGCDVVGVNAFFVRTDLVGSNFAEPLTAENHYEPPRYFLLRTWGHPRGFTG